MVTTRGLPATRSETLVAFYSSQFPYFDIIPSLLTWVDPMAWTISMRHSRRYRTLGGTFALEIGANRSVGTRKYLNRVVEINASTCLMLTEHIIIHRKYWSKVGLKGVSVFSASYASFSMKSQAKARNKAAVIHRARFASVYIPCLCFLSYLFTARVSVSCLRNLSLHHLRPRRLSSYSCLPLRPATYTLFILQKLQDAPPLCLCLSFHDLSFGSL